MHVRDRQPAQPFHAPEEPEFPRAEADDGEGAIVEPKPVRRALTSLDPGWLFLLSGIAIIASVVLIPAQHDLEDARWQRDRAVAIEQHRVERLERYGKYLAAAKLGDECVLLSLGATQLNMAPADRIPLLPSRDVARTSASVFPSLEPGPLKLPELPRDRELSMLERLTVNNTTRLWLIAGGVMCVLFGLLPETSKAAAGALRGAAATGLGMAGDVIAEAKLMQRQKEAENAALDEGRDETAVIEDGDDNIPLARPAAEIDDGSGIEDEESRWAPKAAMTQPSDELGDASNDSDEEAFEGEFEEEAEHDADDDSEALDDDEEEPEENGSTR